MFSCFCQQDSQINVDRGWLEDTCKNVIALPFSKLQFALSWITPRNDVVVHNNGDFYSAENLALSRGSRSFQKVVDQSSPRCFIKPYGHRNQQINITVWLQAAIHCGAVQMYGQQRRFEMALDDHDRLIAYVLGLSHALNIAFFTALAESGESAPRLAKLSSTTFDAQLDVAARVAAENPHLYFEIQSLNPQGIHALEDLLRAVTRLVDIVREGDEPAFVALMEQGRRYLAGRA